MLRGVNVPLWQVLCTQLWDEGVHTTAMCKYKMHILYHNFYFSTGNNIQPIGFYFLEQSSLFWCPMAKGPSLGLSTFDILPEIISVWSLNSIFTSKVKSTLSISILLYRRVSCYNNVMNDSSLAPSSSTPRQIYFYKCHANSWCCKEKLSPSF